MGKKMCDNWGWGTYACILAALLVGFGLGTWIFWTTGSHGKQCEYPNRTLLQEEITALKENVNELQIHNANLTATIMNDQVKLMECESSLTRTRDQLNKKIKETNQCQQEKKNCEKQLLAANHGNSVHRDYSYWLVLCTFCLILLCS